MLQTPDATALGSFLLPYRADVDGLRAVAVILILFFHLRLTAVPGGFVGVDVFFVISGYLITALILREHAAGAFSFGDFYLRRLRRLGPALLFTVALTLVAGWFLLPPDLYEATAQAALASIFSVSNLYFWQQSGYFDISAAYKPLLHTWSLSVEEQFYLVWPALLIGLLTVTGKRILLACAVAITVVTLCVNQALLTRAPEAAFFLTPLRAFEFGAGAILALTGWQARHVASAHAASVMGLVCILYCGATFTKDTAFPGLNAAAAAFGAALMIYAGANGLMNRVLALPPIRYLGQISYSVYLIHWPLIVFAIFIWGEAVETVSVLALLVATLAIGAVMYHLIETPFRLRAGKVSKIGTRATGITCIAAASVVSIASWTIHIREGIPTRYDPQIVALLDDLGERIEERARLTGEWDCNATENSAAAYFENFGDCLPPQTENVVVVLGDSHAADVFMGLSAAFPDVAFAQLTGNQCNFSRSKTTAHRVCDPAMAVWRDWINANAHRINAIIYTQEGAALTTRRAGGLDVFDPALAADLIATLSAFAPADVPFYVWGPRPSFAPQINIAIATSKDKAALQAYYPPSDFAADFALDRQLSAAFAGEFFRYASFMDALCSEGCPVLTRDGTLFIIDDAHWTRAGAAEATTAIATQSSDVMRVLAQLSTEN